MEGEIYTILVLTNEIGCTEEHKGYSICLLYYTYFHKPPAH